MSLTYGNRFWKIFWVDATNEETLGLGYRAVISADAAAKRAGVDGSIESVVEWLSFISKEWLIILDNLGHEASRILGSCVPRGRRGNLLITTRNPNLARQNPLTHASSEVGGLAPADAKLLLAKKISKPDYHNTRHLSSDEDTWIGMIVNELHLHALAIDSAGAAIFSGVSRLDSFLKDLGSYRPQLLASPDFQGESGYNQSLYSTLSLTTNRLGAISSRADASNGGPSPEGVALELLNMFAFFHNNSIMEELFCRAAERNHRRATATSQFLSRHLLGVNTSGEWDYFLFRQGIRLLRASSLVGLDVGKATYSIHPLVHQWLRDRLSISERHQAIIHARAVLTASVDADGDSEPDSDSVAYSRMLVPHLISYLRAAGELEPGMEVYEEASESYCQVFVDAGLWGQAEGLARRLRNHRAAAYGETDSRTLYTSEKLVMALRSGGREHGISQALAIQDGVLREREKTLGSEHAATLRCQIELGSLHLHAGNVVRADALLTSGYEASVRHLGSAHRVSLRASEVLSALYRERGWFDKARLIQRQDLEAKRRLFGDADLRTISSMSNLASTLTWMKKLDESERFKTEVVKLREQLLGETHYDTLAALSNLAVTYMLQAKWSEAEETMMDVISKQKGASDEQPTREMLRAQQIMVNIHLGQGRFAEAASLCREVVARRRAVLGETHSHTLWSLHKLAVILDKLGDTSEAIDMWNQWLSIKQSNRSGNGLQHWSTFEVMHYLGRAYWKIGRAAEARDTIEELLRLKRLQVGADADAATTTNDGRTVAELVELLKTWAAGKNTTA